MKTIANIELSNVTGGAGTGRPVTPQELQNAILYPHTHVGPIVGRPVSPGTINSVIRPR